jgi:hypothetical protein
MTGPLTLLSKEDLVARVLEAEGGCVMVSPPFTPACPLMATPDQVEALFAPDHIQDTLEGPWFGFAHDDGSILAGYITPSRTRIVWVWSGEPVSPRVLDWGGGWQTGRMAAAGGQVLLEVLFEEACLALTGEHLPWAMYDGHPDALRRRHARDEARLLQQLPEGASPSRPVRL